MVLGNVLVYRFDNPENQCSSAEGSLRDLRAEAAAAVTSLDPKERLAMVYGRKGLGSNIIKRLRSGTGGTPQRSIPAARV